MSNVVRCERSNKPDTIRIEPDQSASLAGDNAVELSGAEFARKWGLTLRALRFYVSRGLITPRREGRRRVFDEVAGHRVALVLRAKKLGFTLAEISQMIDVKEGTTLPQDLQLTAKKCLQQIRHLEGRMKSLLEALAELRRIHLELCRKAANPTEDPPR
jgi:DNA-binding transcriptional MerR regulator